MSPVDLSTLSTFVEGSWKVHGRFMEGSSKFHRRFIEGSWSPVDVSTLSTRPYSFAWSGVRYFVREQSEVIFSMLWPVFSSKIALIASRACKTSRALILMSLAFRTTCVVHTHTSAEITRDHTRSHEITREITRDHKRSHEITHIGVRPRETLPRHFLQ